MILTPANIEFLYPKINQEDYIRQVRTGYKEARRSSLLIWTTSEVMDLDLLRDTKALFKSSRTIFESPDFYEEDFLLKIDSCIVWWNVDGILNSIGWLKELNCSTMYGALRNRRHEIVNYSTSFSSKFQGDKIEWQVGNVPTLTLQLERHLYIHAQNKTGNYLNPSLNGLL